MPSKPSFNPTVRFIFLIGLLIFLWFLASALQVDIHAIRERLSQYPLLISGVLFIAIYVGLTTLLWVGTIDFFRITGAWLFGPYWSTLFVWIAETLNATILFHISRKLGREFIEQKFHLKEKDLKYSKSNAGFWGAFVLRINPLVPFRFMDLGFGLTKIPFEKYFWAVVLGSPLRIFWLQFVIAGMGEAMFKDPIALHRYFMNNIPALLLSVVYFLFVIVMTIGAIIGAVVVNKMTKAPSHNVG